ncbi:hypothetical protein BW723_12165 [Polaribacter reichenbachii]|nr:TlpA disulfide reductase family protein [Polaribacter reichenbachii]APZ48144.1 hypothetical protein BW723_12165 [Polaribacter reichenbachii]AUC20411.1 hypothetical protein BTO17_02615 [Polaribacter reichenbachii]
MKKQILMFVIVFNSLITSYAQNNPVPEYLENNTFSKELLSFKMTNLEGKVVSLGEVLELHKGKKVVIDFWASWCRDCILDVPAAKKLKRKTINTDYVYISLDKDIERWKRAITYWKIKGDHYYIKEGWENELSKYVDLDWIPRYIVLDEAGVIKLPKALKISDKEIKEIVD